MRASSNMVQVFVDGKPVEVEPGTTVLQVRKQCDILAMLCFYLFKLHAVNLLVNFKLQDDNEIIEGFFLNYILNK